MQTKQPPRIIGVVISLVFALSFFLVILSTTELALKVTCLVAAVFSILLGLSIQLKWFTE